MISRFKSFLLNICIFALLCMGAVVGGQEAGAQTHAAPQKSATNSFGVSITVVAPTPAPAFVAPLNVDTQSTWTSGYGKSMARTYQGVIYEDRTLAVGQPGCQWACGYGTKIPGTNFDRNWTK